MPSINVCHLNSIYGLQPDFFAALGNETYGEHRGSSKKIIALSGEIIGCNIRTLKNVVAHGDLWSILKIYVVLIFAFVVYHKIPNSGYKSVRCSS